MELLNFDTYKSEVKHWQSMMAGFSCLSAAPLAAFVGGWVVFFCFSIASRSAPLNHIRDRGGLTQRPHLLVLHFLGDLVQVVVQEASAYFFREVLLAQLRLTQRAGLGEPALAQENLVQLAALWKGAEICTAPGLASIFFHFGSTF